ncbi:AraC family transcriptional regulator [Dysgonomonas sp. 520]|uniref:AraC family transcriptional regulator n=1 Tax=Dysgonomonas sp. 520 TaxID=2302931 RepID=UPI0013D6819C|nr:AraC family transcriptional regulator [Dysgonomonas sp. 520]NDW08572.1 AraC family transcriptional regulator [Dysgonomonas sp. 520]
MEKIADGFKGEKAIVTPYNIRHYQAGNKITRQMYITHIGYYPKAKFHFRERSQGTNEFVFIYCEAGAGWIELNGERHELCKNQAFIFPPDQAHAYGSSNSNPWYIYWFHFKGENVDMFQSLIGRLITLPESDKSRFGDRFVLFEEMYQNLEKGYSPENLEYVSFCLMYFLASIKYLDQYREINVVKEVDVVQRAILFMKENLEEKILLKDIADHVGYSASRFGAIFTEKTSYPPMDYYNQLKIQRSCSYLQFSDLKIKEIAFRLGFFDAFHFSKAFKLEMEITPKEYRKRYKN